MTPAAATGRLSTLSRLATDVGAVELARDAEALAERLREGRFYVACVGQFKRGKSSLVNALVGEPVLPTGVIPITAAVTVVRYGERLEARVRFGERDWDECDPQVLAASVSEEQNPGNEKGLTGVEVFVPSPLLASGMCLVDTPGIGSVSAVNAAATRAFVPHIDAALVVLGADPPISGEELGLVRQIAGEVAHLIVVLNKADRFSPIERAEAIGFTGRVLSETLGRSVPDILQVSAAERLAGNGPARDWDALVGRLDALARGAGADLLRAAEERGTRSLVARLVRETDEQRAALVRPVEVFQARVDVLRRAVAEAERSLEDLTHRLTAVQERLSRAFTEERDAFFARALPEAERELREAIRAESATGAARRARAVDQAVEATKRWLDRWRREQEPRAEALYREGVERFVELVDAVQARLAGLPGLEDLSRFALESGLRAKSRFYYTDMLTVAPASSAARLLDVVTPPAWRTGRIEQRSRTWRGCSR